MTYSFCETYSASGSTPWHIRVLSDQGPKLSGGADTPSLCGRTVAWDIKVDLSAHHLSHCCVSCKEKYDSALRATPQEHVGSKS